MVSFLTRDTPERSTHVPSNDEPRVNIQCEKRTRTVKIIRLVIAMSLSTTDGRYRYFIQFVTSIYEEHIATCVHVILRVGTEW